MNSTATRFPLNWHGEYVSCDPGFDVTPLLQETCTLHECELVADDLFSHPLPSVPETSPQMAPSDLPGPQSVCEGSDVDYKAPPKNRKRLRVQKGHANRKKQRASQKSAEMDGPAEWQGTREKYFGCATPTYTESQTTNAHVASTGFTGLNKTGSKQDFTLEQLLGSSLCFRLEKWNGRYG